MNNETKNNASDSVQEQKEKETVFRVNLLKVLTFGITIIILVLFFYFKVKGAMSNISLSDVLTIQHVIFDFLLYLNDRKKITHKVTSFRTKVEKKRT